jgi:hypothetical protein
MERWKDIKGFEGLYQISDKGNVKRIEHKANSSWGGIRIYPEKLKVQGYDKDGYRTVMLYKGRYKKLCKVHRLVAEAFIENPDSLPQINHKDEDKQNNTVSNLEWCDCKYNNNYGTKNKRASKKRMGHKCYAYRDPITCRYVGKLREV